jgi:hypothetical protein
MVEKQTAAVPMRWAFACLDDLEEIAAAKGGIRQLLDEKWRKVYKANAARGVFANSELRAA